jgi:hypothetical protein
VVLFGSLSGQFARSNLLSIFEFEADRFIDFSTRVLIDGFNGIVTCFLSLISKNPKSRFLLELTIFVSVFKFEPRCSNSAASLVQWWFPTTLLFFSCFFIRSVRMLDKLGALIWLFSRAWDAVELTLGIGFFCSLKFIDPTDQGATTVVAPGRMLENFYRPQTQTSLL